MCDKKIADPSDRCGERTGGDYSRIKRLADNLVHSLNHCVNVDTVSGSTLLQIL